MIILVLRWVLWGGVALGVAFLVWALLRWRKSRHRPRPSGFPWSTALSYKKLNFGKNPHKYDKSAVFSDPAVGQEGVGLEKLTLADAHSHLLGNHHFSLSLLLSARAAERGLLPFYSLCGAMFIDAVPRRLYHLNQEYQAVLLSDIINIPDDVEYTHVLAVYRGEAEPVLAITSEHNPLLESGEGVAYEARVPTPASLSWGQQLWNHEGRSHELSLFFEEDHESLDRSDRWANLEMFETRALKLATDTLHIDTTPYMVDDGSASSYVDLSDWDDVTRKMFLYCLELHGMFLMIHIAMLEEPDEDDLERASLHRFRIDVFLETLARQERLPMELTLMMLADLHVFRKHIQEKLEPQGLSYLEVLSPVYDEDTILVHVDLLSWEDRHMLQASLPDNQALLDTLESLMAVVEETADVQVEESTSDAVPTFDV